MGRLIDTDSLIETITQGWFLDILLTQNGQRDIERKLVDMIDSVPLAFDKDKVVEELMIESENHRIIDDDDYFIGLSYGYEGAIEIVERGGIEC